MKTSPAEVLRKTEACIKRGSLEKALDTLLTYFKENRDQESVNEVLLLLSNLSGLKRAKELYGESVQREQNRITDAILSLRNKIIPEEERPAPPPTHIYKEAKLLHDIARKMKVGTPVPCIVRLAPDKISLLKYFKRSPDTKIRTIDQIGGVIKVAIKPLNRGDFKVQLVGNPERKIFPDIYTEWKFFVTPLREGRHTLNLNIVLTRQDATGTAPWEVVFNEEIEVVSNVIAEKTTWKEVGDFKSSPMAMAALPWWMFISVGHPWIIKLMASIVATGAGLGLAMYILPLLAPADRTTMKAFVHPNTHFFRPSVTYQHAMLRYEKNETSDVLTVDVPESKDERDTILWVTDQGRTFSGRVNRTTNMVRLYPFEGTVILQPSPSTITYLKVVTREEHIMIIIDSFITYLADKTGEGYYAIPYADTLRRHYFAYKDSTFICEATALLRKNGDTIELIRSPLTVSHGYPSLPPAAYGYKPPAPAAYAYKPPAPAAYGYKPPPPTILPLSALTTKVTMSLPQKTKTARVSVNGMAITKFEQRARGTRGYVVFKVPRSERAIKVEVRDEYCIYRAGGTPSAKESTWRQTCPITVSRPELKWNCPKACKK